MGRSDNTFTRQLVQEIDDAGIGLSKSEINFIADLIDRDVTEFTQEQTRRVKAIHQKRVNESDPDLDID